MSKDDMDHGFSEAWSSVPSYLDVLHRANQTHSEKAHPAAHLLTNAYSRNPISHQVVLDVFVSYCNFCKSIRALVERTREGRHVATFLRRFMAAFSKLSYGEEDLL
jgi:hypothetical protein